jgi:hypothetical protein
VEPAQLSWVTQDGAQCALGFSPDMASCHGHHRAADGDVVEVRGGLEDRWEYPQGTDGGRGYEFETQVEDAGGWHPAGGLRVLIDEGGESPVRWAAWRERSGDACSVALRSVCRSGNADLGDLVSAVWASAENRDAGEVAANLVDASDSKWFAPHDRASLEFRLTEPIAADQYTLTSANDAPDRDPSAWTLSGSLDGRSWRTLDSRSGQSFARRHQSRTFQIIEPAAYAHYRLEITGTNGSPHLQLEAVRFLAESSGFVGYRQREGESPCAYRGIRLAHEPLNAPSVAPKVAPTEPLPLDPPNGAHSHAADAQPAFEDFAPAAEITLGSYLYRKNMMGAVSQTVKREPGGTLRASSGPMSYTFATTSLARWLEQDGTVLTWRTDGTDPELCLVDAAGNLLWREYSAAFPPPAAPHEHGGPAMGLGSRLYRQSLTSSSGSHTLLHHSDGDLVLYCNVTHAPVWRSGTDWLGDSWLDLTRRGDLVLRTSCGAPVWKSETADTGVVQLAVRDDGSLALLDAAGTALWQIHEHAPCAAAAGHIPGRGAVLRRGQSLRNQSLTSADGESVLRHQPEDGVSLICSEASSSVWTEHTSRAVGACLTLDHEGYLQVQAEDGSVLTRLAGPGEYVIVVPRGEVRLCAHDGTVLWREGRHVIDEGEDITALSPRTAPAAALETILNARRTPIVRTDFSDEHAWQSAWRDITKPRDYWDEEIVLNATLVALPEFEGWSGQDLATVVSHARHRLAHLVLVVDAVALASPEHPVLVVEVDPDSEEQPRSFRATPHALVDLETQLSIANMDWEDFSEGTDPDGILRTSMGADDIEPPSPEPLPA